MITPTPPTTTIAILAALYFAGCGTGSPEQADGGLCAPQATRLCLIEQPPLPMFLWPWHCTDGTARGRHWCALCDPAQPTYCITADDLTCVPSCASCQVPGWPACKPEQDAPDWVPADLAGAIGP